MQAAATAFPAALCPVCGQPNRCAMEVERETGVQQPPCWCTQVDFSRELLDSLPAQARGRACVCQSCATGAAARLPVSP